MADPLQLPHPTTTLIPKLHSPITSLLQLHWRITAPVRQNPRIPCLWMTPIGPHRLVCILRCTQSRRHMALRATDLLLRPQPGHRQQDPSARKTPDPRLRNVEGVTQPDLNQQGLV